MILLGGNGTYLGIQHRDVLNMRVVDVILDSIILANGTHTDTVCTITVDVLNEDVGGVSKRMRQQFSIASKSASAVHD